MFDKCANPECSASFNYREGWIYRFRHEPMEKAYQNAHAVKHYWLCRQCLEMYLLEDRESEGVSLRLRLEVPKQQPVLQVAPEIVALPPRKAVRAARRLVQGFQKASRKRVSGSPVAASMDRFPLAVASTSPAI